MAHLSGGAEARANSSRVLTTDSRPRDTHESLWGKIDPKSFGDRAARGTPQPESLWGKIDPKSFGDRAARGTPQPESLWGKIDPKSFGDRAARGTPQDLQDKLDKSHANKSKKSSMRKRKRALELDKSHANKSKKSSMGKRKRALELDESQAKKSKRKRALELDESHANKSKKSSMGKRKRALELDESHAKKSKRKRALELDESHANKSKKSSMGKRKRALEPCKKKKNLNNNQYKKPKTQQQERDWAEMPTDALSVIFLKLGAFEVLLSAQMVCRPWRKLSLDPTQQFWRTIDMRCQTPTIMYGFDQDELTIAAVERSGGNMEELHVMRVSDKFLTLMSNRTDRTSKLRCCALIMCLHLTPELLADFLCQCPLLEELHIYRCFLTPEAYGAVGRACPRVKTLWVDGKYKSDSSSDYDSEAEYDVVKAETILWNDNFNLQPVESHSETNTELSLDDKVAMEIAKTMPQLRELQLIKDFKLTKWGLCCILDKCLHLQFLDIRRSFNVRIDNTLQAKLDKIKFVRLSRRSRISLAEEAARGETIDMGKALWGMLYWKKKKV